MHKIAKLFLLCAIGVIYLFQGIIATVTSDYSHLIAFTLLLGFGGLVYVLSKTIQRRNS